MLFYDTLVHGEVCLPRIKEPPLSYVLHVKPIVVILQVYFFLLLFRHITESKFNRICSAFLLLKFGMLWGVLMFTNGMRSKNPLDIIDAQSPHKMVFLLVDLSLRITGCIMCLLLVYFMFGMQQNMVFLHVYFVVLFCQFLELYIKRLNLRKHLSVNYFVGLLIF